MTGSLSLKWEANRVHCKLNKRSEIIKQRWGWSTQLNKNALGTFPDALLDAVRQGSRNRLNIKNTWADFKTPDSQATAQINTTTISRGGTQALFQGRIVSNFNLYSYHLGMELLLQHGFQFGRWVTGGAWDSAFLSNSQVMLLLLLLIGQQSLMPRFCTHYNAQGRF